MNDLEANIVVYFLLYCCIINIFFYLFADGNLVIEEEYAPMPAKDPVGFDELLKQAQQKLKKKR